MIDDEDSSTEQERAEAEALARAIEGEPTSAPADAVATATLLRAAGTKSELASDRSRAVYDGLEQAVEHYVKPRSSGTVVTLAALGACLAAAAALVLYVSSPESPDIVPAPPAELLAAQAALGAGGASDAARMTFERAMRAHRSGVLRALMNVYPSLLFVERAHVRADAAAPEAREALAAALGEPVPVEVTTEHRRVVQQDLLFRLARAELAHGRFTEALVATDRGLKLGSARDLFAANLLVARGEALEKLGRKAEAAAAYFEALEINRKLLHDALEP